MNTFNTVTLIIITVLIIVVLTNFKVTVSHNSSNSNISATNKSGLRPSCLLCVRKHIGQAIALLSEVHKGYPNHKWLALGHLAEAEDESVKDYPNLSAMIRNARINIQDGVDTNLVNFFQYIDDMK